MKNDFYLYLAIGLSDADSHTLFFINFQLYDNEYLLKTFVLKKKYAPFMLSMVIDCDQICMIIINWKDKSDQFFIVIRLWAFFKMLCFFFLWLMIIDYFTICKLKRYWVPFIEMLVKAFQFLKINFIKFLKVKLKK